MATDTLSPPPIQEALFEAGGALLTAQIMAGSLKRLIDRIIDDSAGDPAIWDDANAALACVEHLRTTVAKGLEFTDKFQSPAGSAK